MEESLPPSLGQFEIAAKFPQKEIGDLHQLPHVKFDGRASRPAFWWWFLFAILVAIAANIIDSAINSSIISILASLALLLPNLSVAIRRLHDTDHTGWWVLIGFIPIIGWIVLLIFYLREGDAGGNRYGPPPTEGVAAPSPA